MHWLEQTIRNTLVANTASLLGLLFTIVGFTIALIQIGRTRTVSNQVKRQVDSVRKDLRKRDLLLDLSSTIQLASELKSGQLEARWASLPPRYSDLKGKITSVRATCDENSPSRKVLQYCIVVVGRIQEDIEEALVMNSTPTDVISLNKGMNRVVEKLQGVLADISAEIGR